MYRPYYRYTGGLGGGQRCFTASAVYLRECFRLLWEQHVYWTRMTIISIAMDLPDVEATTNRLLRNAADFARLFARFYGARVAAEFERLLTAHLVIAAELVKAARDGNNKLAADAEKRWYANADEITSFLHRINSFWHIEPMQAMWHEHLSLTKQEAVARLNKDYAKDIEIFNRIEKQALSMADELSRGIYWQHYLNY